MSHAFTNSSFQEEAQRLGFLIRDDGFVVWYEEGKSPDDCLLVTEAIDCDSDDFNDTRAAEEDAAERLYNRLGFPSHAPLFIGVREGDRHFCARLGIRI